VIPRRRGISKRSHVRAVGRDLALAVSQTALTITMLAHQAWLMSDAIARTFIRVYVTRRHLLEWVTAAQAKAGLRLDLRGFYRRMGWGIALAAVAAVSLAAAGAWTESGVGWLSSLPERKSSFSDNGISLEVNMAPGTGVSFEREGAWPSSSRATIRMSSDNVNATGNDYVPSEAFFPVSVTFAFGEDFVSMGFWPRVGLFFRHLWSGFPPSGIRLTYAWGNALPVGSMYRLWEEETVFVVAGPEEAGKTISSTRRLADDFNAAYGRPPKGPVTEVRVSASRPYREKGPMRASITVRFPAAQE